ncbi:uncharacterized protein [Periplaneta americana]|uniref:uncharacterized protein isoform X2 n=1 Tax=Periplaneta americana TaxID=6978 RepID=UPI0037E75803
MSGNNNTEESDEAINQHLEDLGLLEEGMTPEDKRNLWAVIKISKDTAHAEEQDRQKRARRNLQFDEVSSRTETLSESKPTSGSDVENDVNTSSEKMNESGDDEEDDDDDDDDDDDEAEEERRPKVAAVAPQLHSTPQAGITPNPRTTATVPPLHRSGVRDKPQNIENSLPISTPSHSVTPKKVLSPSQQDGFDGEHSPSLLRSSMTPSARRGLRSQTGMSSSKLSPMREIRESSPGSLSSKVIIHDIILDSKEPVKEREQDSEALSISFKSDASKTRKETIIKVTILDDNCEQDSSSPVPGQSSKNFDHDETESRASSEHESSPVRKIRQSLKTSLNFQQNVSKEISSKTCEMKSEVDNENCSEQSNISALDEEETVKMDKEISASVGPASDNVPSPLSDSLLNESPPPSGVNNSHSDVKKIGEDKERNIDAFNCDRSNYERTLKVRKVKRTCSRQPFYIPPYKMNIHTYIAYFKRCVNEQAARLIEVQRKNHKCVPWGDPVVVGESNSRALVCLDQGDQKSNSVTNLQRYNFRDRKIAHQKVDTIYEDPGDVPSDDDMFINVSKKEKNTVKKQKDTTDDLFDTLLEKSAPEKDDNSEKEGLAHGEGNTIANSSLTDRQGSMKRKSDSSDDQMFDQDEKSSEPQEKRAAPSQWLTASKEDVPPVAVKRKKFGTDEGVDDESDIFADLDKAEGVGDIFLSRPGSKQDSDVIRPGPLKLRKQGRRRVQQSKEEADEIEEVKEEKQNEASQRDDISVVYDAGGSSSKKEQDEDLVPCPICRKTFPPKDIEAHASECNEYCEEEISPDEQHISPASSPDMIQQSPHGSITQQCWSEFDSGQAIEEDHYTRQRNQSRRPQTRQELVLEGGEGEIEAPLSPIHCFVPISAQQDSEIDYYNQFRVSAASTEAIVRGRVGKKRTYKRKKKRGPKKQRAKKRKKTAPARTKISSFGCAKKLKDVW